MSTLVVEASLLAENRPGVYEASTKSVVAIGRRRDFRVAPAVW